MNKAQSFTDMEIIIKNYNSQFDQRYRKGVAAEDYFATINTAKDYILVRKQFDDCDAIVVQRNRITELQKKKKMVTGDTVRVERNDGPVETDWKIYSINGENCVARKGDLEKPIKYSRLLEMNTSAGIEKLVL